MKLVFFGFTYCPDICPSALDRISTAFDKLGPKADGVVALFVSFDTERDTPKVLADYLSNFHKNIVGLTGTPAEIDASPAPTGSTSRRSTTSTRPPATPSITPRWST